MINSGSLWRHSLSILVPLLLSYLVLKIEVRSLALEILFGNRGWLVSFLGSGAMLIMLLLVLRPALFPIVGLCYVCLFLLRCIKDNSETDVRCVLVGTMCSNSIRNWYLLSLCVCAPTQVLQTLGTETYRPSSASQCVAGIACAEIPVNQWPELIPQLVANVTNPNSTEHMKESTLEAIGYICQDIVSTVSNLCTADSL